MTWQSGLWLLVEARSAIKRLRRAPGFVLPFGLSYGLGFWIALTTTGLASQFGLRPPSGVEEPRFLRRVYVQRSSSQAPWAVAPVLSYPELEQLQRFREGVQVEGYSHEVAMIGRGDARRRTTIGLISPDFLRLLRVELQSGRFPSVDDEPNGAASVAVISDRFWQRHFARSQSAVGSVMSVNAQPVRVIGILSPNFIGLDRTAIDAWMPIRIAPILSEHRRLSDDSYYLSAIGRVTNAEQVPSIERRLLGVLADRPGVGGKITDIRLERIAADRIGRAAAGGRSATLALALAGGVLVLSLANCILLTLGRVQQRLQELRTRLAVGAQIAALVFSVALEIAIVMAVFTGPALLAVAKSKHLLRVGASADAPPLVDGFLVSVMAPLVVGALLMVFSGSTIGLIAQLRRPVTTGHSAPAAGSLRRLLIGTYITVVCALAISCLPIWRAHILIKSVRPGFNASSAVVVTVAAGQATHDRSRELAQRTTLLRLQAHPFVYAAGVSSALPYRTSTTRSIACFAGNQPELAAHVYAVSGDFLGALGVPIELGNATRLAQDPLGDFVVINRALATRCWPESPIGKCLFANGNRCSLVVAVAGNVDAIGFGEPPRPTIYAPSFWHPGSETVHFVVRTKAEPTAAMVRDIDQIVGETFPSATVQTELLHEIVHEQSAFLRLLGRLTMLLMLVAGALALFGLNASVQYSVRRRRHELGIRAALGASPPGLMRSAASELLVPSVVGAALGQWLGAGAAHLLGSLMPGLEGSLPLQLGVGGLAPLLLLALSAVPAWKTSREQPSTLLAASL